MKIISIFLIVVSVFVLYKRFSLIIFGKSACGYIIGSGNRTKGTKGIDAYGYKVKYQYNGVEYIANALESTTSPNKNIDRKVKVYFKENRTDVVTIKDFKGTTVVGTAFLLLGVLGLIL